MHRARQFYLKVHRTSVTCDVMRHRRTYTRPRGRGKVRGWELEVEVNLYNVSKDVMSSHTRRAQDMSHRGEGKAVLVISQFPTTSLSLSLTTTQRRTRSSRKWSIPAPLESCLLDWSSRFQDNNHVLRSRLIYERSAFVCVSKTVWILWCYA